MKRVLFLILLILGLAGAATAQPPPEVKLDAGRVRGQMEDGVAVYRGIPFAAPPVGGLRWAPPRPPAHWDDVRDATRNSVSCMQRMNADGQPNAGGASGPMSEDCLYLNVFAPPRARKAPVMVWIYGGANTLGSGVIYDMKPFARDGIVVVSMNYRLGPFGFFAHPALTRAAGPNDPLGNYGLMDQVAALRWVKHNAAAFGGDPDNVTLFGEFSAGAMDILALMPVTAVRGLFNKVIMESNIGWGSSTPLARAEQNGVNLTTRLGWSPASNPAELRRIPAETLNNAGGGVQTIIDGRHILESTEAAWDKGLAIDVPLIIGSNSYEASLQGLQQPQADICTNSEGVAPARWIARQESGGAPSYMYFFSYVRDSDRPTAVGAAHASEIAFTENTLLRPGQPPPSRADQAVANVMHSCWVAFAKTGKPRCAGGPAWPAYDPKTDQIYEFAARPVVRTNFRKAELDAAEIEPQRDADRLRSSEVTLRRLIRLFQLTVVLAACACATPGGTGGTDMTLGPTGQHVETTVYKSHILSADPVLVIVLHGDAPLLKPAYQDDFANHLAQSTDNVLAVGLLRPGYADPFGRRSDPQDGPHIGDNYTPAVTVQVDTAIRELQARYHPSRTVLVGHSGGAAVAANLIEADHGLANAALLVSCPCDLAAWRARMGRFGGRRAHRDSTSPLEHAADLPDIPVVIMVGAKDHTVGVANSQSFYAGAKAAGANVTLQIVKGSGHMMLGDAAPLKVAADLAHAP